VKSEIIMVSPIFKRLLKKLLHSKLWDGALKFYETLVVLYGQKKTKSKC
jgi:hypothetical protein